MWYDCINMGGIGFFPLLLILLIAFFTYNLLVKEKVRFNSSLDILNSRYAKGDIDKDEYERIRREIT
jgi:putative membrane protein